jgi:hypothetical protein
MRNRPLETCDGHRLALAELGVRKAKHFSDACAQIFPSGDFPKSEDCLYLNVWTEQYTRWRELRKLQDMA